MREGTHLQCSRQTQQRIGFSSGSLRLMSPSILFLQSPVVLGTGLQRKLLVPHLLSENTPLTGGRWILFPFPYLKTPISTKTLGKGTGKASLRQWGHHRPGLAMRNPLHHCQETQDCLCQSPGVPSHCSLMLPTGRERKSCLLCWAEGPGSRALKEIIVFITRGLLARAGGQMTDTLQKV